MQRGRRQLGEMPRLARLAAACLCTATLAPTAALSQDATWRADASSSSFSVISNWDPAVVPRGFATFGPSRQTDIFINANSGASVVAFAFTPDAPAYTFNPSFGSFGITSQLVFRGGGIVNNSANAPTFLNPFGSVLFISG